MARSSRPSARISALAAMPAHAPLSHERSCANLEPRGAALVGQSVRSGPICWASRGRGILGGLTIPRCVV